MLCYCMLVYAFIKNKNNNNKQTKKNCLNQARGLLSARLTSHEHKKKELSHLVRQLVDALSRLVRQLVDALSHLVRQLVDALSRLVRQSML